MEYQFPPEVDSLVRSQMATGRYATEDELLKDALLALSEREETLADIRAGIEDMEAGRMRPLDDVAEEIRRKHGFAAT